MFDAILFVQLGSPADASPESVEKYLVEFLGDWHTLGNPPFFWNFLLRHIIAPKRSVKSAAKYQKMIEASGLGTMPLIYHTEQFLSEISRKMETKIPVKIAFEFGTKPSIYDSLSELSEIGAKNIRVIPLFPQKSLVTTVAVHDLCAREFEKFKNLKMEFVDGFAMNKVWLDEIASAVLRQWNRKDVVLFSFHGTPQKWVLQGDPYQRDCEMEFAYFCKRILAVEPKAKIRISYQSRLGPVKWLGPYTSSVIEQLGTAHESVLLVCPSFTADNLETLYECDVELKEAFLEFGGKEFSRVPCLNASASWTERFAKEILRKNLD